MGLDMPNYQTLGLAHRPGTDAVSGSPFGNSANLSSENYIYFMDYADNASEKIGAGLLTDKIIPAGNFYPSWNPEGPTYAFSSFTQIAKEYTGNKNGNWKQKW